MRYLCCDGKIVPSGGAHVFIKTVKAKGYEYIQLVESFREDGKTKHRVLYNFGRRDFLSNDKMFQNIARRLGEIAGLTTEMKTSYLPECDDAVSLNYGYLAYLRLWQKLGIENSLHNLQERSKISYSLSETALLMAVQHLLAPRSKLGAYEHQGDYLGFAQIELHQLYRTLDKLAESKHHLEEALFRENYVKAGQQLDVVFYDVTTFAFESVVADSLREFGYSKDHKFGEVQVVMGLLIDSRGMPVGYELFPGSTYEGNTLDEMVKKLKTLQKRFGIRRVILVADRGINSKNNLKKLRDAGFGYIVASRLKTQRKALLEQVFDQEGYTQSGIGDDAFLYKVIEHTNVVTDETRQKHELPEHYIVTYSPRRAAKDRADRQRLVDKALRMASNPSLVKSSFNRGGRRFLKQIAGNDATYAVDAALIARDERFDGYYAIQTSEKELSVAEVVDAYKTLWRIEDSFRLMKSTLEVRPIFHWTPQRIEGHFVVCFLAFLLERAIELLLAEHHVDGVSSTKIRDALNSMRLLRFTLDGKDVFLKERHLPLASRIFSLLKIPSLKNLTEFEELRRTLAADINLQPQLTLL